MILLDTDHCIFFIRGRPTVVAAFAEHASDEPPISVVTVGELYFGALRSARPESNLGLCREFIQRVTVLALDDDIMFRFARLKADLFARGQPLEDPDLLIAATAIERGMTLITHNASHYARVPELRLEDWLG